MRAVVGRVVLLGLLAVLVGCDQVTKVVAKSELENGPPRDLVRGVLDLHYTENTDVAFNLLRAVPESIRRPALIVLGAVAVVALVALLMRRHSQRLVVEAALVLVTAGAIGNYVDRLTRGYVVDFVHLHHWPVFNVADVYVTGGGVLLAALFLFVRGGRSGPAIERPAR